MSKFKVGDKVVKASGDPWYLQEKPLFATIIKIAFSGDYILENIVGTWCEDKLKLYEENKDYFKGCKGCKYFDGIECNNLVLCTGQDKFEKGKGGIMSKTFKEVIADIKYMELWICKNSHQHDEIKIFKDKTGIQIVDKNENSIKWISDEVTFTLQRKKVSFTEAFKSYEEGKEIESCVSGNDFNKSIHEEFGNPLTSMGDIRGEWFIND